MSTNCDYSVIFLRWKLTAGGWGGCGVGLEPGIVIFHCSMGNSVWSLQSKATAHSSLSVRGDMANISIAAS